VSLPRLTIPVDSSGDRARVRELGDVGSGRTATVAATSTFCSGASAATARSSARAHGALEAYPAHATAVLGLTPLDTGSMCCLRLSR